MVNYKKLKKNSTYFNKLYESKNFDKYFDKIYKYCLKHENNKNCCYALGYMHKYRRNLDKNEAPKYFLKSAKKGNKKARDYLHNYYKMTK